MSHVTQTGPVFVMSPIGHRTGGPEALHQLVHTLRLQGVEAYLTPYDMGQNGSPVPEFDHYECGPARPLPPGGAFHLVLPELRLRHDLSPLVRQLNGTRASLWLWWLSVDNSHHPAAARFARSTTPHQWLAVPGSGSQQHPPLGIAGRLRAARYGQRIASRLRQLDRRDVRFLAQSDYAADFCRTRLGRPAILVSDYLGMQPVVSSQSSQSPHQISYNGAKAGPLIHDLIASMPEATFVPLLNMTEEQVAMTLAGSAAYVELGALPGRDRLPREAIRLNTPVVMLKRGAGRYPGDFPLPDSYRIDFDDAWVDAMSTQLRHVLADPTAAQSDQAAYRSWVLQDRERFGSEVADWVDALNS